MSLWRVVLAKEVRERLRDRRTIVLNFLLPLAFYPLLGFGLAEWGSRYAARQEEKATRVALRAAPEDRARLGDALAWEKKIVLVVDGPAEVVVESPPGLARALDGGGSATIALRYDRTDDAAEVGLARVRRALDREGARIREERLRARGVAPSLVEPLRIEEKSTATPRRVAEQAASRILPLLLLLLALTGALYPAIDLTAGEKERGTLETLLAAPVPRRDLVAGKFLAVVALSLVGALLNLLSVGLTALLLVRAPVGGAAAAGIEVPWSRLFAVAPAALLIAVFVSAVMMAVASTARTARDAQTFAGPAYLALMVPGFAAQLPDIELGWATATIPSANVALLVRALMSGTLRVGPAALCVASTLGYAALALAFAERLFRGETLLFGGEAREARRGGATTTGTRASPGEALALLAIVLVLMVYLGARWQAASLLPGLAATEIVLVLAPCLLLARWRGLDRRALGAVRAPAAAFAGAALCGLGAWAAALAIVDVQQRAWPIPHEWIARLRELLAPARPRPLALDLAVLAALPALCEETLFRGVLLRATLPLLGAWRAALLNAALFGAFHLSIYRFAPTATLGLLLAVVAIRAGSAVPGMVFHAAHNGIAVLLARAVGPEVAVGETPLPPAATAAGILAVAAGLWLSGRGRTRPPYETRRFREVDDHVSR